MFCCSNGMTISFCFDYMQISQQNVLQQMDWTSKPCLVLYDNTFNSSDYTVSNNEMIRE
jgi:hypothetical protein